MVIKNTNSNPLYYFIEVEANNLEMSDCLAWCKKTFGMANDKNWLYEDLGLIRKIKLYRFRFANITHRDWFILRWS